MKFQRKRVAIIFYDNWLPYSPTVLNLYDQLSEHVDVVIFNQLSAKRRYRGDIGDRAVVDLDGVRTTLVDKMVYVFNRVLRRGAASESYARFLQARRLRRALSGFRPDRVIAVDANALKAVQEATGTCVDFMSLEFNGEREWKNINKERIGAVLIESETRYRYLFGDVAKERYILPNSPVFHPTEKPETRPDELIYCGTTIGYHGVYSCLRLLRTYPQFFLTIKGTVLTEFNDDIMKHYPELVEAGRLRFDTDYVSMAELDRYLSRFRIGLCLYDRRFNHKNDFHLREINSGKMYRYFSSGVPVVANNLPGLNAVRQFQAGVLVEELTPDALFHAINTIEMNYDRYVANCFTAARHFSFDTYARPYVDQVVSA